ncbi:unnamed protein product [Rhizophagus irregularis]|nr:unnamed protein product [Rhizophagus irregularis]
MYYAGVYLAVFSWNSLPEVLKSILPQNYSYLIENFNELPSYRTTENFIIPQFELDVFVDIDNEEKAHEWFMAFESKSKTTMPETKRSREIKRQQSSQLRNTNCTSTIHLQLERWRIELSHPLEVNIKFTHNHVIISAESLSFRRVNEKVRERFLELFKDGHSSASAMYTHEDELYLSAADEQELLLLLADRASNLDYDYIFNLFRQYRQDSLGDRNGSAMFRRLAEVVNDYNNSGKGQVILQEYDSRSGKAFILCVVTGLMSRVHEKILQSSEICYMDASASFEPLNTSITLLYTSYAVGALPLGLFITSDELEITLEKALNLLKSILPQHAFYGRGAQLGPKIFLTDDSSAERNALELCWPESIRLLCTFHVLQAFWRWLHNSKHYINKADREPIMQKMKEILYAPSDLEMHKYYCEFKQRFYGQYPQLHKHFELMWERRSIWALSFRSEFHIRGNNTNNYIERSFGIIKDIVFARTQAYNCVQVFQFITQNMERFYSLRLLNFAHRRPGYLRIAKRFLCSGWDTVNMDSIKKHSIENEFFVKSVNNSGHFYTVNSEIGTCTCRIGMTGAPCKHQGAISVKFHISMFNFIPSLTSNDRMIYAYIAIGYTAEDSSFYVSLHAEFISQDREGLQMETTMPNSNLTIEYSESNKNVKDDITIFINFLEEIKEDYSNGCAQLHTALNKFAEHYKTAKLKSIPRLVSFLYDINRELNPAVNIRSGSMIRVQVESVKR